MVLPSVEALLALPVLFVLGSLCEPSIFMLKSYEAATMHVRQPYGSHIICIMYGIWYI